MNTPECQSWASDVETEYRERKCLHLDHIWVRSRARIGTHFCNEGIVATACSGGMTPLEFLTHHYGDGAKGEHTTDRGESLER